MFRHNLKLNQSCNRMLINSLQFKERFLQKDFEGTLCKGHKKGFRHCNCIQIINFFKNYTG